jgi:hypothetical protein
MKALLQLTFRLRKDLEKCACHVCGPALEAVTDIGGGLWVSGGGWWGEEG